MADNKATGIIRKALAAQLQGSAGAPFIFEDHEVVSLHFDAANVQSSMRKSAPIDLELSYTRTMMGFLLMQPAPADILAIGLGGGSLPKFCYHRLPDSRVKAVEINEAVVAMRKEFQIPDDDDRFQVIRADGAKYLSGRWQSTDVILLDAYTEKGMPDAFKTQTFYEHCFMALRAGGVLVINLWESDTRNGVHLQRLREVFDNQVLKVRASQSHNDIVFAVKADGPLPWGEMVARVPVLQSSLGLGFHAMIASMRASYRHRQELDVILP